MINLISNTNIADNNILFYGMIISVVVHLSLNYLFAVQHDNKLMIETGVQTDDLEEEFSDTASIETISPTSSTFKKTSAMNPTKSEVEIQTIAEGVPNQDTVERVIDYTNAEYIAAKVEELNALDPFSATP
jgi:hypothetical protein